MEHITYPLLCYPLPTGQVLGVLVGTNIEAVDSDVRSLKSSLAEHLQRLYKKNGDYEYIDILEPKMRVFEIKIRPTYRSDNGNFPTSKYLKVPVFVVYGETESDTFECYLPALGEAFYYYEAKQLKTLVEHNATSTLSRMSPEEIHHLILAPIPTLETVTLRINPHREMRTRLPDDERDFPRLARLAERYPQTKALQRRTSILPDAAWEMEPHIDNAVDKIVNVRANVLLVGNSGVGKSAVLKAAIRRITGKSGRSPQGFTFWSIMSQRITASAKYLGEWQEAAEELVNDLQRANGILWVLDVIQLLQTGGEGAEDSVAAFLSPFLREGKLQMLGECTPRQLESMKRLLPGFVECFQIIKMEELEEKQLFNIFGQFAEYSQKTLKVNLQKPAWELSYRLLARYFPYESFPGKAVKFLSQAINEAQASQRDTVSRADVIQLFTQQTGLPELFLRDDLFLDEAELRQYFEKNIIGQSTAIDALCGVVKIFKAGLSNSRKPIAVMILAGPTGVGKTASAKALADYFFGKGQQKTPLIRLDMSEFQHPSQLSRFTGSGGNPGQFVQDLRERPFAVLLLDEIEKANPAVFDALMTVFDEGMMTDAYGRVTNFRNTIILMTTNLGASNRASIGYGGGAAVSYESAIGGHFRPEFVNRIDSVVAFNPLGADEIRQITLKELELVRQREGFIKRNIKLIFEESLIAHLASIGFDERYGARPLQRAIEDDLIAPLAKFLLSVHERENFLVKVEMENGVLKISAQN